MNKWLCLAMLIVVLLLAVVLFPHKRKDAIREDFDIYTHYPVPLYGEPSIGARIVLKDGYAVWEKSGASDHGVDDAERKMSNE